MNTKTVITVRMSPEFQARLKACAEREQQSVNQYCLSAIKGAMDCDDEWETFGKYQFAEEANE